MQIAGHGLRLEAVQAAQVVNRFLERAPGLEGFEVANVLPEEDVMSRRPDRNRIGRCSRRHRGKKPAYLALAGVKGFRRKAGAVGIGIVDRLVNGGQQRGFLDRLDDVRIASRVDSFVQRLGQD